MGEKIRVVIADDQGLVTQGFKVLLETAAADIAVVGTARDGREALAVAQQERPAVILLDVRMPVMDGVQAAVEIHRLIPEVKIIMLTTFDDDAYVHEAIRAGAVGYLLKDISTDELISSIRAVHHGAALFSASVAHRIFQKGPDAPSAAMDQHSAEIREHLSKREIEILRLLVAGLENKEIAERLFAAEQTIKNAVSILYSKLGVENRREARRFALASGLVQPGEIPRET